MIWSEIDLAYLSGLIDGEASISIFYSGKRYHQRLDIYNTNEAVLLWIKSIFGGNVNKVSRQRKNWKQEYVWSCGPQYASNILLSCLPYLKIKSEHAKLFVKYSSTSLGRGGRAVPLEVSEIRLQIVSELKKLNQRGI